MYADKKISNKKVVIIYGNCHTQVISEMLNSSTLFCEKYEIYPIKPICVIDSKDYFELPIFGICDVFIHQSIRLNNCYGEEFASEKIIQKLKPECIIIAIPNLYHLPTCFFPQYTEEAELQWKGITVFFRDKIIDEGYKNHLGVRNILSNYQRYDLFMSDDICQEFDRFIDKVIMREKEWDIKISDFILNNYKEHQLFYDPNHPTNFLLNYISNEVIKLLLNSDKGDGIDYFDNIGVEKCACLDTYEMPVCNAVRKALQIRGGYNDIYRCTSAGKKVCNVTMRLPQYVKQYCAMEWVNNEMKLTSRMGSFVSWFLMKMRQKLSIQKEE